MSVSAAAAPASPSPVFTLPVQGALFQTVYKVHNGLGVDYLRYNEPRAETYACCYDDRRVSAVNGVAMEIDVTKLSEQEKRDRKIANVFYCRQFSSDRDAGKEDWRTGEIRIPQNLPAHIQALFDLPAKSRVQAPNQSTLLSGS